MTAAEFASLPLDEKCSLVWARGQFLANYVAGKYISHLYHFQGYLVEIAHSTSNASIDSVILLDPPALDTLYQYVRRVILPIDDFHDDATTAA